MVSTEASLNFPALKLNLNREERSFSEVSKVPLILLVFLGYQSVFFIHLPSPDVCVSISDPLSSHAYIMRVYTHLCRLPLMVSSFSLPSLERVVLDGELSSPYFISPVMNLEAVAPIYKQTLEVTRSQLEIVSGCCAVHW